MKRLARHITKKQGAGKGPIFGIVTATMVKRRGLSMAFMGWIVRDEPRLFAAPAVPTATLAGQSRESLRKGCTVSPARVWGTSDPRGKLASELV